MRNIKLIIEYDGTGFNGWQAQVKSKRLRTIQEEIEKAAKNFSIKKSLLLALLGLIQVFMQRPRLQISG